MHKCCPLVNVACIKLVIQIATCRGEFSKSWKVASRATNLAK